MRRDVFKKKGRVNQYRMKKEIIINAAANETRRDELAEQFARRSIELLTRATDAGFDEFDRLGPGTDFDPVRQRPDFQKLQKKLGF